MTRFAGIWDTLRTSFWFLPAVTSTVAAALAIALILLDRAMADSMVRGLAWLYLGGADGARSLLSTLAGAVITVVGVAFSVTVVSLQLASSQFGPRILRTFIRDRGNQVVLGTLVATFVYCLVVLRSVRGEDAVQGGFVPHVAVTGAVALGVVSIAALIYFVHHLSVSIQADRVIAAVAHDLEGAIETLYPEQIGDGEQHVTARVPAVPAGLEQRAHTVEGRASGYLQMVDAERIVDLARQRDLVIRVEPPPGAFLIPGAPLASVWPAERGDDDLDAAVRRCFVLNDQRTLVQDLGFGVHQLVEIAVRALSPSVNDPFTALACLDRLAAALASIATRRSPSPYRRDADGRLRVIARPLTMDELTHVAFDPILRHGSRNAAILAKMLEVIATVARRTGRPDLRAALLHQAQLIERDARHTIRAPRERALIVERFETARRLLAPAAPARADEREVA